MKAFGLIATKMPDGSSGYSMIVFITAEDFRPYPLGMGFTLLGIGGMIAINRTFDEAAMREGLKNNTLGDLLFPARSDPPTRPRSFASWRRCSRRDAAAICSASLAKIGWFTPVIVVFDTRGHPRVRRAQAAASCSAAISATAAVARERPGSPQRRHARRDRLRRGRVEVDAVLVDSRLAHKFC